MPKVERNKNAQLDLKCDNSEDSFYVRYTNMGEPYREGIEIGIENTVNYESVSVMLCDYEAKELRDMLINRYPLK